MAEKLKSKNIKLPWFDVYLIVVTVLYLFWRFFIFQQRM